MKASIEGGDSEGCGLEVVDNNDVEHWIEIKYDSGEISYHEQEGYPDDPEERTLEENEHVAQAQRFAKFYVYRNRGYDTMSPLPNPDVLVLVSGLINLLSEDAFEQYFGDYYQQMQAYPDGELVTDVPAEARSNPLFFQKDVYISITGDDVDTFIAGANEDTQAVLSTLFDDVLTAETAEFAERLAAASESQLEIDSVDEHRLADTLLEAVSGVHVMWSPASNETETIRVDSVQIERKPDARFELPPYEPDSIEDFRDHLRAHLDSQIRDCYLTMGIAPPEQFRVQGPGWFDRSTWFQHYDVYEPYHDPDAEITDWQEDTTPEEFL